MSDLQQRCRNKHLDRLVAGGWGAAEPKVWLLRCKGSVRSLRRSNFQACGLPIGKHRQFGCWDDSPATDLNVQSMWHLYPKLFIYLYVCINGDLFCFFVASHGAILFSSLLARPVEVLSLLVLLCRRGVLSLVAADPLLVWRLSLRAAYDLRRVLRLGLGKPPEGCFPSAKTQECEG